MLKASSICFGFKSSTLISDLYGLMRPILYVIFIVQHCSSTMPLVKHGVITKGPLYGVSYFYAVWIVIMTLSPTLQSQSALCLFSRALYLQLASVFADVLIPNPTYVLSGESYHGQISIGTDYNFFLLIVEQIENTAVAKMPAHGLFLSTQVYCTLKVCTRFPRTW